MENDKWKMIRSLPLAVLTLIVLTLHPVAIPAQRRATITVNFTPGHPANRFIPSHAFGAGVDGHAEGETDRQLSPTNIAAMLSAGFKPLTYRLRTELAGEAWHWNPNGSWSDPSHRQGYWTSSSALGQPIHVCYGYRLPRRGNTIDQANDDGYSRLDDGDAETFWKSNPYLDEHFTKEDNSISPRWVMIDLGGPKKIDAVRILWSQPFATDFSVEYGHFVGPEDLSQRLPTEWRAFPRGKITKGAGGDALLKLSLTPVTVRFVRIRLNESSGTSASNSSDVRDRLGYAIREIYLGSLDRRGRLRDVIHHAATRNDQTIVYVSSTDPWHREIDRDEQTEQPGFDFICNSGLTNGLPLLLPVPVLYDTPENAAAEIRYLKARGYAFERIEMGEEPDGQFVAPEHFAALYLQFAKAIHDIDRTLRLGGPSLQDIEQSQVPGRIEFGKAGWLGRFLDYLKRHGQLDKFSFFSFEWYPSGNNMLFFRDDAGHITKPTATYWGARLLTQEWAKPGNEVHEIYPAVSDVRDRNGQPLVTAYAVHRPDGLWSLLLINKDREHAYLTTQIFRKNASGSIEGFAGQLDLYQYSQKQYVLGGPPSNPYPIKADEPEHRLIQSSPPRPTSISLPPYSLTVIRGQLSR